MKKEYRDMKKGKFFFEKEKIFLKKEKMGEGLMRDTKASSLLALSYL